MSDARTTQTFSSDERARAAWHISTRSSEGGSACVEAGPFADAARVAVRHSHQPAGDVIVYSGPEWKSFVYKVGTGALDHHRLG